MDSLYEFHPEFFAQLSSVEMADLALYYRVGLEPPPDFVRYWTAVIKRSPGLPARAQAAYRHVLRLSGTRGKE
ncbi:MAG: hypothetical protein R2698_15200 [Microthrixaceae bacterium]